MGHVTQNYIIIALKFELDFLLVLAIYILWATFLLSQGNYLRTPWETFLQSHIEDKSPHLLPYKL